MFCLGGTIYFNRCRASTFWELPKLPEIRFQHQSWRWQSFYAFEVFCFHSFTTTVLVDAKKANKIKRSCFRSEWNKTCVCVSYSRFHTFFRRFLTGRKILRGKKVSLYRRSSWTSWSLIVRHVLTRSLSSGKIDWIDLKVWRSNKKAGAWDVVIRRHFKVSSSQSDEMKSFRKPFPVTPFRQDQSNLAHWVCVWVSNKLVEAMTRFMSLNENTFLYRSTFLSFS